MSVSIGKKLELARVSRPEQYSQTDVGRLLEIPRATYAAYEREQIRKVPTHILRKLSTEWGIPYDWWLDGKESPVPASWAAPTPKKGSDSIGVRYALIPLWRGVLAGEAEDPEICSTDDHIRVPALIVSEEPESHFAAAISGRSMAPRVDAGDTVVVRLDSTLRVNCLAMFEDDERRRFLKVCRKTSKGDLGLFSLNPDFEPIFEIKNWKVVGYVVAIMHDYEQGRPNLEWDEGRALRG